MSPSDNGSPTFPPRGAVIAAFAAIYLIWGSTYLAIRVAIDTMPPLLMLGTRFAVAGLALYLWARWRGAPAPTARQWRGAALVGLLMPACGTGSVAWAEQFIPSGLAALLVATVPLWVVLIETFWERGRRLDGRVATGVAAGFAGVALLLAPESVVGGGTAVPAGAWIVVLAAAAWATGSVYSRHAPRPASQSLSTGMQMTAGGALLVVAGLALGEGGQVAFEGFSLASLLAFGYQIVFGSFIAFSAYLWLLQVTSPSRVATYAYVNPVVALFLGWSLGGEALDARLLVVAMVILGSVALILKAPRPKTRRAVEELPRTAYGKVVKGELRRVYLGEEG